VEPLPSAAGAASPSPQQPPAPRPAAPSQASPALVLLDVKRSTSFVAQPAGYQWRFRVRNESHQRVSGATLRYRLVSADAARPSAPEQTLPLPGIEAGARLWVTSPRTASPSHGTYRLEAWLVESPQPTGSLPPGLGSASPQAAPGSTAGSTQQPVLEPSPAPAAPRQAELQGRRVLSARFRF
jgi:hypothetical protein